MDSFDYSKFKFSGGGNSGDINDMTLALLKLMNHNVDLILEYDERFKNWREENAALVSCF